MPKWTMTEAGAKRIFKAYLQTRVNSRGTYGCLATLDKCIDEEGCQIHDMRGRMLRWMSEDHPHEVVQIACELSGEYNNLKQKLDDLTPMLETLLIEIKDQ